MKIAIPALLLCSQVAWSAIPNHTKDILNLPAENRRMAIQNIGPEQFVNLADAAFSGKETMRVRWAALMSLAEADSKKALPLLIQASKDKEWFMRNAALVALSETQPVQAEKVARTLLKDKALVVRSAAVEVLKKYPTSENRDLLWAELEEKYNFHNQASLWIRPQIVQLLAQKPSDHEKLIFARLLKDKDPRISTASVHGLEKLTGMRLGAEKTSPDKLVSMWSDYLQKEGREAAF